MKQRNRLRVLRADRRITQLDLGLKTKIAVNRIWRIENGYAEATQEEQDALAKFFRVPLVDVFPGEAVAS